MKTGLFLSVLFMWTPFLWAEVEVGKNAPAFGEKNQEGITKSLSDYEGDWVVLEWFNRGCPYVQKHYKNTNSVSKTFADGNMQKLQKKYTNKGVKWLTVVSSAEGKQGYVKASEAKKEMENYGMNSTELLLDSDGSMGQAYGAKTTPHMFVINPTGQVIYAGAIDSNSSADPEYIKTSTNYVDQALKMAMSDKEVNVKSTRPYGCSVKY